MKSLFKVTLLVLITISISCGEPGQESEQNCIPGENCPYNQGECSDNQCVCKDGFYTLIDSSKNTVDQKFCNYKQISMKLMLLFEVLIPGSGQLYSHNWIFGIIKLALFVCFLIISFGITKQILIPKCCIIVKDALIGEGKDDKKEEEKDEKSKGRKKKNEIDIKDDEKDDEKLDIENEKDNNENNNNPKKDDNNVKSLINDCMDFEALSVDKLKFGSSTSLSAKTMKIILKIFIYLFWVVYSVDIYLIFFKIYSDGKGIPYGD